MTKILKRVRVVPLVAGVVLLAASSIAAGSPVTAGVAGLNVAGETAYPVPAQFDNLIAPTPAAPAVPTTSITPTSATLAHPLPSGAVSSAVSQSGDYVAYLVPFASGRRLAWQPNSIVGSTNYARYAQVPGDVTAPYWTIHANPAGRGLVSEYVCDRGGGVGGWPGTHDIWCFDPVTGMVVSLSGNWSVWGN